jgi:hypothetical protein
VQRQEEELAAKEKALDTASVDAQALQHALEEARSSAARQQVFHIPNLYVPQQREILIVSSLHSLNHLLS